MPRAGCSRPKAMPLVGLALLAMMVAAFTFPVRQAWAEPAGAFEVSGGNEGVAWSYETGVGPEGTNVLTVKDKADLTIAMAQGFDRSRNDTIVIADGAHASVTLDSVKISLTAMGNTSALDVSNATLDLTLVGSSSLSGGQSAASVFVPEGSALTVTKESKGSLVAVSHGGAGIGGSADVPSSGAISIMGGTVTANGEMGAGIGPSLGGSAGTIAISDASINAASTQRGCAGIGAANNSSGNTDITISNADVTATALEGTAIGASGSDSEQTCNSIVKIIGGTVKATSDGEGAAIGGGQGFQGNVDVTISNADVTANTLGGTAIGMSGSDSEQTCNSTVKIIGGTVNATSGGKGAAIGGGQSYQGNVDVTISDADVTASGGHGIGWYKGQKGSVCISGGKVTVDSGSDRVGIGTYDGGSGTISIKKATVRTTGGINLSPGETGAGGSITLSDSDVSVEKDAGGVALGVRPSRDQDKASAEIMISGGKVELGQDPSVSGLSDGSIICNTKGASDGKIDIINSDVKAVSGEDRATIGGMASGCAGTINISNSTVEAISYQSTAIGGAADSQKGSIRITGSKVTAQGANLSGIGVVFNKKDSSASSIVIDSSTVTSTVKNHGSGIGNGPLCPGGDIQITNSDVSASTPRDGAGIGVGNLATSGSIKIDGGHVNTLGNQGAGIGSCYYSSDIRIEISGATVTAACGSGCPAIGTGYGSKDGVVDISNSNITATGGWAAPGIGFGAFGTGGMLTIEGGTITAVGGDGGPGIGSRRGGAMNGSSGDTVVIKSGTITATGGANAPGIGSLATAGTKDELSISGGSILAVPGKGSKAIDSDAISITGGIFGKGEVAENPATDPGRAYEWAPDQGYVALDNVDGATKGTYPVRIYRLKTYDLSGNAKIETLYNGATPDVGLFALSDGDQDVPGFDGLIAGAKFRYHAADADRPDGLSQDDEWSDGLPKDAGSYSVESTIGISRDDAGNIVYVPKEPLGTALTIDRKPIEISSATVESKDWDGKRDATVDSVEFRGVIDGEALGTPQDYTATALFDDAEAGKGKSVKVTADLIENGPVAKNYTMDDGKGTFKTAADIRPIGGDHGNGANSAAGGGASRAVHGGLASAGDVAGLSSVIALAAGAGAVGLAAVYRRRTER